MTSFLVLDDAVVFAGEISDAALKSCYLLSNVFLFTSKHEGFSVPLVESNGDEGAHSKLRRCRSP